MPTLNATVFPNEAYVLVQADWSGATYRDTFERVFSPGWSPADTGQPYTISAGAATEFFINGAQGIVRHTGVSSNRMITADVNMLDVEFSGTFTSTSVPVGDSLEVRFAVRWVNALNFIDARLFLLTTGTVTCDIRQVVAGVTIGSGPVAIPGLSNTGIYGFTIRAVGTMVFFRAWNAATTVEPLTWSHTFTTTWVTAGDVGVGSFVSALVTTPTPILFAFDNFVAFDPNAVTSDCAVVTRRNTVTGEVVTLRPYIYYNSDGGLMLECGQGLWWDTEPPLDVPLEYCTFACDSDQILSTNTGFGNGATAPWVATGGVLTSSTAFAHSGTSSGLLTPSGTAENPSISQTFAGVVGGVPLTMSAWAMSPQGWNAVILRLSMLYVDGTTQTVESVVYPLEDGQWRFMTQEFTPRLDGTATFSFVAIGVPAASVLFYVDQIMATQNVVPTATACETVTVPGNGNFWLKNPLHPCLDVLVGMCSPMLQDCEDDSRVSFASMPQESYGPNTVLLQPVNRRRPIPVNRVRRDVEATLRLIAHDCDARDAVMAANEPGDPLLWQAPAVYCTPDRYMSVGVVDDLKISVDHREPFRLISLPHVAVDRPEGPSDGVCGARITDLCDTYTSWAALTIAGFTWTDLLLGLASPNGPGQPDQPEGARTWDDVNAEFVNFDAVEAGGTRDWDELRDGL